MLEEFFADDEGTLEEAAVGAWPAFSIGQIRRAIASGAVTLNGLAAPRTARVVPGDFIAIDLATADVPKIKEVKVPLGVLFEDQHLLAVDKPPGVSVVPERGSPDWRFMGMLLYHAANCRLWAREVRFRIVHRLDRDTSGAVLVAKSAEAGRALSGAFAGREVKKRYIALVAAEAPAESGEITVPIAPSRKRGRVMSVADSGRESLTGWRVLERFRGYTLLEVVPRTGRTHQIRVHLSYAGLPLAVDDMYGGARLLRLSDIKRGYKRSGEERPLIGRLSLHCAALEFPHPVTRRTITVEAALPEDFDRTLKALRKWARRD